MADQLNAPKGGGSRAYIDGLPAGARSAACRPPAPGGGAITHASLSAPYVMWRDPFVYFHSLLKGGSCQQRNVPISRLATDLKAVKSTPALSYIVPSLCEDGSERPCRTGAPAGLASAVRFLQAVVPEIQHSPAYKANGLIAITSDQAPQSGPHRDTSSCCDAQVFPNLPLTAGTGSPSSSASTLTTSSPASSPSATTVSSSTTSSPSLPTSSTSAATTTTTTASTPAGGAPIGGGQVGLLLISRYVKPGSVDFVDSYNHFSLLATIEKLLGAPRLGYASDPALPVLGAANFNNP